MDRKPAESKNDGENAGLPRNITSRGNMFTRWSQSLFPNLRDAAIRWSEDDASSLAASVAYYLALSLFPMMLLLSSGIGLFFQFSNVGRDAEAQILNAVEQQTSPIVRQQVAEVLHQLRNQSIVSGPFGVLAAVMAAIGVFAQIDRGFDRIFRIVPQKNSTVQRTIYRIVRHRCFAFVMLVCLGGTILVLFASSMFLAQFRSVTSSSLPRLVHVFGVFDNLAAVSMNALLFTMVYRWLPKKKVYWLDALRGGILAACVWELGRTVLGVFFIGMRYTSAYGVIGSFIALLLWCYYGISILFFGAEYVQVLELHRHPDPTDPLARRHDAAISQELSQPMHELPLHSIESIEYDVHPCEVEASLLTPGTEDSQSPLAANALSEAGRPLVVSHLVEDRQLPRRSSPPSN